MLLPKITWNGDGSLPGVTNTLNFTYPPVKKPGANELVAENHVTITGAGQKQTINERVDQFLTLTLDFVPQADQANWKTFLLYALTGAPFTYYPDATDAATHTDYSLEDTTWKPQYSFRSIDKFALRLREWVP